LGGVHTAKGGEGLCLEKTKEKSGTSSSYYPSQESGAPIGGLNLKLYRTHPMVPLQYFVSVVRAAIPEPQKQGWFGAQQDRGRLFGLRTGMI
jgi:hypothetical protein